ncbi:hypothetical protein ACJJTC_017537 [Scirpophaga incertulas]
MTTHGISIFLISILFYIIYMKHCMAASQMSNLSESVRRCLSRTFYRKSCNVCWCSESGMTDENTCTNSVCDHNSKFKSLDYLINSTNKCQPNSFSKPRCIYCTCSTNGYMNKYACLELDCLKTDDFSYNASAYNCGPGEMVPVCLECFCLANGMTNKTYCSEVCSQKSKLHIIEKVWTDAKKNANIIAKDEITRTVKNDSCEPNTIYLDQDRHCLCPESGRAQYELCTSDTHFLDAALKGDGNKNKRTETSLNSSCLPNTFVEFDCNTCYCSKNGTIDPKWCTYDDCQAKKTVESRLKKDSYIRSVNVNNSCISGIITIVDCNYCICPESGLLKHKACTNIKCTDVRDVVNYIFTCEPLGYYLVDCKVCLCPQNGIKNVNMCTKNMCDKVLLRSDSCTPGEFFSKDCNVCVCPPNGVKTDKVCTNHICIETEDPWNNTLKISQSVLGSHKPTFENRDLDVCFSGEQYEVGCQVCVCPDVGLRSYAKCIDTCEDAVEHANNTLDSSEMTDSTEGGEEMDTPRIQRQKRETNCLNVDITDSSERRKCTPGSTYIIRCKQCICPYSGNINYFCRDLPRGTYCEQAFPNFNYIPMGRKFAKDNEIAKRLIGSDNLDIHTIFPNETLNHSHTNYNCSKAGNLSDTCFICECEENGMVLIEEHCFKSDNEKCVDAVPTFLDTVTKMVLV